MDVLVKTDGELRYILSCPDQMEWNARVDLVEALKAATSGQIFHSVIVDLDKVSFINSAGLGAIFALRKYAKELGANVAVARPGPAISRLLQAVNLPALLPVAMTLEAARQSLQEPANPSKN